MIDNEVPLTINGKPTAFAGIRTVGDLIRAKGLKTTLVAVELNGAIVPRAEFESRELQVGDKLEIVHFVGGG